MLAPLHSTIQLGRLLLKTNLDKNQEKLVIGIITSSQLVMYFCNDLVDSSLIEHGRLVPRIETSSPEEAINEILELISIDCESKKLGYNCNMQELKNSQMDFDKQRFQQVLLNLMKNAIKFSPSGAGDILVIAKLISEY